LYHTFVMGLVGLLALVAPVLAQGGWERYVDPDLGYRIDLPTGQFKRIEADPPLVRLHRDETDALLEVYGGYNRDRLSLSESVDFLSQADRIAEITYRTGGRSWFVISGYYRREEPSDPSLIFYAKVMFSRDLERFSAFEISYPQRYKRQMDPVVEALESSLRPPA
jgi:hypothetical protein